MSAEPDPIEVVEYDPRWPVQFSELKQVLEDQLGELVLGIEHVGSTAVPGLAAKPILDIDTIVDSRDRLRAVIGKLAELGYVHEGDLGITGREAFKRLDPRVPYDGSGKAWPDHHLYVCTQDNRELQRHLSFRNCLRHNPHLRFKYAELKRTLAGRFRNDRTAYTEAKTSFVEHVLQGIGQDECGKDGSPAT